MRAMTGDLVWREVPEPEPGPGEVLVEVAATAVNRADLLQVQGFYPPPPGAPAYLGLECSGRLADGSEVCALLAGGGYAERVAVPEGQLLPVPRGVSLIEAAALPEVACTVWSNVTMVGRLAAGETVLIHGGGSGIGTFAIQYAKALGARVVATARREKHEKLRELGADELLDYREDDFSGVQADLVLDIIGGAYLGKNVTALTTGGRLVIIGLQGGRRAELDLGALVSKRLTVAGTTLRSRPVAEKAAIVSAVREQVWPMLEDGRIRPVIDETFPVEEAAKAHERVAANAHLGKVVLTVSAA
ncbi:putative PIG3 family NAD(P)H quinone oxidoreductase [Hamadaea flava]|uniref:NAD(P)H-quinone oxidoreductase n=1 Tax=Hamadaea flava TaxID=1742688 RepID=A0ABV8LFD1_9ACTN|nr:NAD(P)H-quinone oxidoreductase [Hamadaea flava]MCP2326175.1 putative PIG3 family NAD(P)H quinone oxidoreductase [Hamadaea flava]